MMRSICAVQTCRNRGIHVFPQCAESRRRWIRALRWDVIGTDRQLIKYGYICSEHFKPSDFIISPPLFEGDPGIKRLKNNSVPSIFPWTAAQNTSIVQEGENLNIPLKTYGRTELPIAFVEEIPFMGLEPSAEQNPLQLDNEECEIEEPYTISHPLNISNYVKYDEYHNK